MPNLEQPEWEYDNPAFRRARVGDAAGCDHLGVSLYGLDPGQEMVFHYHLGNEELLIVVRGRVELRTAEGEREIGEGGVVAFPRGEQGAHGFRNSGERPAEVLVVSEMNAPNVSVYPDTNEIGVYDAPRRAERRFGARFELVDARSGYGGADPKLPDSAAAICNAARAPSNSLLLGGVRSGAWFRPYGEQVAVCCLDRHGPPGRVVAENPRRGLEPCDVPVELKNL